MAEALIWIIHIQEERISWLRLYQFPGPSAAAAYRNIDQHRLWWGSWSF